MLDRVLIEGVGREVVFSSRNSEGIPWYEPEQKAFAAAVRAIALDGLVNLTLSGELHGTAVTASRLHICPLSS